MTQPGWSPSPSGPLQRPGEGKRERFAGVKREAKDLVVAGIALLGMCLALDADVTVLTGATPVWVGVAIAAIGTLGAWSLRASTIAKVVTSIMLAVAVLSGVYTEHAVSEKREEIRQELSHLTPPEG